MTLKKLLYATLSLLFAAIGLYACDDDTEISPMSLEKTELIVTPSDAIIFETEGGSTLLKIDAKGKKWNINKSNWINVAPNFERNELEVTVGPCETREGRKGEVTITCETESVSIKVLQKGVTPSLSADKNALKFDTEGGEEVIKITAIHVEWTVKKPAEDWVTINTDRVKGEICVKVASNPQPTKRTTEFTISGEGVENICVNISQEAQTLTDFWDRSVAERLGYSDKVKTVSQHIDLINNNGSVIFTDLEFDQTGNLLKFNRGDNMTVMVTYDTKNRIQKITAKSADYDFYFLMEYGSHGNYIPLFEIFEYDLDVPLPIDFRVWMPFLVKDLCALRVRDNLEPGNNMDYHFNSTDNNMTIDLYMEDGTPLFPQYYLIEFNGIYPMRLVSEGIETGVYKTDPETGMILHQIMHSYYDIEYERNTDHRNTISRAVFGSYDMSISYNERLDIASRQSNHNDAIPSFTAEYKYDKGNNWLEMILKYYDQHTEPFSRTISYW